VTITLAPHSGKSKSPTTVAPIRLILEVSDGLVVTVTITIGASESRIGRRAASEKLDGKSWIVADGGKTVREQGD
jgi:hypothetical protein